MLARTLSCCALCIVLCSQVQAENWPQWRGPRGDGVSAEKGLPTNWSDKQNTRWQAPLPGPAGATPVVWGDRIFVSSVRGDDLVLLCFNTKDGRQLWEQKVGTGNRNARVSEGNSASPSPSTDGEHVWVFFGTGVLACYDFAGKEIWKFDVADRFGKIDIQFGMSSTPALQGDALYLQLIHGAMKHGDDTRTGKVIKLDKLTGKTIWEFERVTQAVFENKHSYASPFVYDDGQRRFVVAHGADCTTGHDLESGKELWRLGQLNGPTELNSKKHDPTFRFVASPAVVKDWIIVPTAKSGPTVALHVDDQLQGNKVAESKNVRWTLPETPDVSIPLVANGLVYTLAKNGRFQCIELETGKVVYADKHAHDTEHRASPVMVGDHIYLCAKDGTVTVVKAGREFEIVAKNKLDAPITASPVVANGTLFIRTYQTLYAIE